MTIDTHLHIVDQSALRYPWLAGAPALNRDFFYEEYAREAKRGGISATLHMEVDVAPDDIEAETSMWRARRESRAACCAAPSPPAGRKRSASWTI